MIWRSRKKPGQEPSPPQEREMPTTQDTPIRDTTAEDIARAEAAARRAAIDLHAARERREKIDNLAEEIKRLNRENGFAEMIRNAFGS